MGMPIVGVITAGRLPTFVQGLGGALTRAVHDHASSLMIIVIVIITVRIVGGGIGIGVIVLCTAAAREIGRGGKARDAHDEHHRCTEHGKGEPRHLDLIWSFGLID